MADPCSASGPLNGAGEGQVHVLSADAHRTSFAQEIAEIAKPTRVGLDHDSWGFDHGTWSALVHASPKADVPVPQIHRFQ